MMKNRLRNIVSPLTPRLSFPPSLDSHSQLERRENKREKITKTCVNVPFYLFSLSLTRCCLYLAFSSLFLFAVIDGEEKSFCVHVSWS